MEENLKNNNTHKLFKQVRELKGKRYRSIIAMKDSHGYLKTKKQDVLYITLRNTSTHNSTTTKMLCKNLIQ